MHLVTRDGLLVSTMSNMLPTCLDLNINTYTNTWKTVTVTLSVQLSHTVNHYNTFCKDIPGLVNDEVTGVTMDSHNVDASTNSTPQVTLSSTAPADTRDEQSFRDV